MSHFQRNELGHSFQSNFDHELDHHDCNYRRDHRVQTFHWRTWNCESVNLERKCFKSVCFGLLKAEPWQTVSQIAYFVGACRLNQQFRWKKHYSVIDGFSDQSSNYSLPKKFLIINKLENFAKPQNMFILFIFVSLRFIFVSFITYLSQS